MIMILIKTFLFLFPFIKELLFGKETTSAKRPNSKQRPPSWLQKVLLSGGICLSIVGNIYLGKQLYDCTSEKLLLSYEHQDRLEELDQRKQTIDSLEREQLKCALIQTAPGLMTNPTGNVQSVKREPVVKPAPPSEHHRETLQRLQQINQISRMGNYTGVPHP